MTDARPPSAVFYNLQICRAIAALMVIFSHANEYVPSLFEDFFVTGYTGVDFFFVLSGFIIYHVNRRMIGKPQEFRSFIAKRFVRIYPIYWVCTLIAIGFAWMVAADGSAALPSAVKIIKSVTLYPTRTEIGEWPIDPVAWTLTFELMFYAIFSIGILLGRKVLCAVLFIWIAAILAVWLGGIEKPGRSMIETFVKTRNFEFLFGCLIAHAMFAGKTIKSSPAAIGLLIVGISILYGSWIADWISVGARKPKDLAFITFGIPYSIIIYSLVCLENHHVGGVFKRAAVYLGDASYSIYLTHAIWLSQSFMLAGFVTRNPYLSFAISCALMVLIGVLCYRYVEQPLTQLISSKIRKPERNPADGPHPPVPLRGAG